VLEDSRSDMSASIPIVTSSPNCNTPPVGVCANSVVAPDSSWAALDGALGRVSVGDVWGGGRRPWGPDVGVVRCMTRPSSEGRDVEVPLGDGGM